MNVCGVTRLLVPASFVGMAVATIAGRDVYGLIAALATAAVLHLVGRVRGTNQVCAIPGPPDDGPVLGVAPIEGIEGSAAIKRTSADESRRSRRWLSR